MKKQKKRKEWRGPFFFGESISKRREKGLFLVVYTGFYLNPRKNVLY